MKNFPIESVKVKIRRNSYIMTSSIYIVTDYELNKHITYVLSVDKIIIIAQVAATWACFTVVAFEYVEQLMMK